MNNYLEKELENFINAHKVWVTNCYTEMQLWQTTDDFRKEFFPVFEKKTRLHYGRIPEYITSNPELYSKLQKIKTIRYNYFFDVVQVYNINTQSIEHYTIFDLMIKYDMNVTSLKKLFKYKYRFKNLLCIKNQEINL